MEDSSKWQNDSIPGDEDNAPQRKGKREGIKAVDNSQQLSEANVKMSELEPDSPNMSSLKAELEELEKEENLPQKKGTSFNEEKKSLPLNSNTASGCGTSKNKKPQEKKELSQEEKDKRLRKFILRNETIVKHYGMLTEYKDSKEFLLKHNHIITEDASRFLNMWAVDLAMEGEYELSDRASHQGFCLQYILQVLKATDLDPKDCVVTFFDKMDSDDLQYKFIFKLGWVRCRSRIMFETTKLKEEFRRKPIKVYFI